MRKLRLPEPSSGGLFLSYRCTSSCKHCMYACSPRWKSDWISVQDAEEILTRLAGKIQPSPSGPDRVGVNWGLHFTGGEPFLNFDLLLELTGIAYKLKIPSTFVETNCVWCTEDEVTRQRLKELKDAGLCGILISVNPFLQEEVPFERAERAVRISKEIFGENVMVYQEFFYQQFKRLNLKGTLALDEYLQRVGRESLSYVELFPMSRAVYKVSELCKYLYGSHPMEHFFGTSCVSELTREWHVHIDNYRNYMLGYCGGLVWGDFLKLASKNMMVNLDDFPIMRALLDEGVEGLYHISKKFGYKERKEGYSFKCDLCVDIRRHIAQRTNQFVELNPREFYFQLE